MMTTVNPVLEALKAKHAALAQHKPAHPVRKHKPVPDHQIVMGHVVPYVKMTDARSEKEKAKYPFVYCWDYERKCWVIEDAYGNSDDMRYNDRDECAIAVSKLNVANARALGYTVIG